MDEPHRGQRIGSDGQHGIEGRIGHPQVLNPQERFHQRIQRRQDGANGVRVRQPLDRVLYRQQGLDQLFIGDVAHGAEHDNQHRERQQHRQTAAQGVDFFLAVQLRLFALELFAVVAVFLLQRLQLGIDFFHAAHGFAALVVKRQQDQANQNGEDDYRPSVAANN